MSIISDAKEVVELVKKLGQQELFLKIVDLQAQIIELSGAKHQLEVENAELKKRRDISERIAYREPFVFLEGDENPLCSKCYEGEEKTIHLTDMHNGYFQCPNCKNIFARPGANSGWEPAV